MESNRLTGQRLAILYPGDRAMRDRADPRESRFAALFEAFAGAGVAATPAVYHDDFADEVRTQLRGVDGVLVWHNPIEGGRSRAVLDALLSETAGCGVFVSSHPDTILRLGTKDVLIDVRELPFGSDVCRVDTPAQLASDVRARLAAGSRVLKQHRGHSGIGVWRVEELAGERFALRHAQRGSVDETVDLATLVQRLAPYFRDGQHMIDQAWQPRMVEGMVRAYLVRDRVAGFGHQAINALYPAQRGEPAPSPGPRLYSGPEDVRFQQLRTRLEYGWVSLLLERTGVSRRALPLLWDADFMLGARESELEERYVLCEVNVSSVSPFPESAIAPLVAATKIALAR
ncbi:MAG: Cj0069 family protein [Betaproteobacteria bacterium]